MDSEIKKVMQLDMFADLPGFKPRHKVLERKVVVKNPTKDPIETIMQCADNPEHRPMVWSTKAARGGRYICPDCPQD